MKRDSGTQSLHKQERNEEGYLVAIQFSCGKERKDSEAETKSPEGGSENLGEQLTGCRTDPRTRNWQTHA